MIGEPPFDYLARIAEVEVQRAQHGLPEALLKEALKAPVTVERLPEASLEDEPDPVATDTLGLFVGEAFPDFGQELLPLPAQIILYLENIWEFSEGDERTYRREVRKTYLHELGHYLARILRECFITGFGDSRHPISARRGGFDDD